MSQTKAQLIQPVGVVTAGGVVVTGVLTASSFTGDVVGSATSIISGGNLNLGDVNATTFSGDFTGTATGINTGADIKVGQFTASSFTGDFTGTATSMFRGTGFKAGAVNATGFHVSGSSSGDITGNVTGNATGLAGGLGVNYNGGWTGAGTSQINAGVITATTFYGDGQYLDGVSSGPVSQQSIGITSAATTIDLSNGNLIFATQSADTTVSFANTENGNVYIVRTKDDTSTARTITWPTGIGWSGGSAPTLLSNPRSSDAQVFLLVTRDMGVTWYGKEVVNFDPQTSELWVWGYNDSYLGMNNNDPSLSSPIQLGTDTNWNTSASRSHRGGGVVLVPKTDGTLWGWGAGADGQFGNNTSGPSAKRSSPIQISGMEGVTSVFYDGPSVAAVGDAKLWVWGTNQQGIFGQNGAYNKGNYKWSSPVQIPGTTWRSVNGWVNNSYSRLIATKTDGTLWGWGGNSWGMLADNSKTSRSSPTQIGTGTDWSTACHVQYYGSHHIKTDGTLWTWGHNIQGVFGLNQPTNTKRSSPVQVPGTTWSGVTGTDIAGGVLALKTDGTLWAWGKNEHGMLGLNQDHDIGIYSSPIQIGTDTTWNGVSSKTSSTLATKTDGTAWSWGYNGSGDLGHNDKANRSSPTQIPGTSWTNPRWLNYIATLQKPV